MGERELLDRIHTTAWIRELLVDFDFDTERVADGPVEEDCRLADGRDLEIIAGDSTGGAIMLAGPPGAHDRPVVYLGSEGEGGLIAHNLRDALAIIVGFPNLHDALGRPWGDDGGAALREFIAGEDDYMRQFEPDLDDKRERIRAALDLPAADDRLLRRYHLDAADDAFRPVSPSGEVYESLLRA